MLVRSQPAPTTHNGFFESLFNTFSPKKVMPYQNPFLNTSYELLFCDDASLYRNEMTIPHYPWDILFSRESEVDEVKAIYLDGRIDTRPRIVACNLLSGAGIEVHEQELLGVVVEIHSHKGLDVLAVYADGSARLINHLENIIVWEASTEASSELTGRLFGKGKAALTQLLPWYNARKKFPQGKNTRISLLASDGIYLKEGEYEKLAQNPVSAALLETAEEFMHFLSEQQYLHSRKEDKNVFC